MVNLYSFIFCRVLAGIKRFTLGIIYLAMFTVLQPKVKESFLVTDEYDVSFFFHDMAQHDNDLLVTKGHT